MKRETVISYIDGIQANLNKAEAICHITSQVNTFADQLPSDAVGNAMWAATDLIREAHGLVGKLYERTKGSGGVVELGNAKAA